MKDNFFFHPITPDHVVNCFQKLLSSWWRTTTTEDFLLGKALWIAFKNYYLRDEGQHLMFSGSLFSCCELLSKIIIFVMKDNPKVQSFLFLQVVNCFQKLLSSWWRTTFFWSIWRKSMLWIAFKNYYLRDEGQLRMLPTSRLSSCELLSKIIIFVMKDNYQKQLPNRLTVVNCFQKLLSSWWRTTRFIITIKRLLLWIAFKNYYLRDEGQQTYFRNHFFFCCELLSKIIIFVMKDNLEASRYWRLSVVNCFQKLLSSWWRTTMFFWQCGYQLLWIAFKNYYLRDEGQQ